MAEKLNGIHGRSLFIDGIEVLRITKDERGEDQISLGPHVGTAIKYLDHPEKLEEDRAAIKKILDDFSAQTYKDQTKPRIQ